MVEEGEDGNPVPVTGESVDLDALESQASGGVEIDDDADDEDAVTV